MTNEFGLVEILLILLALPCAAVAVAGFLLFHASKGERNPEL